MQQSPFPSPSTHRTQLYTTESYLHRQVARFVESGFDHAESAVLVATPAHWKGVREQLEGQGVDVDSLLRDGRLHNVDAEEALLQLMVDGAPNRAALDAVLKPSLRDARAAAPRVRVYGELVDLLWTRGELEKAETLEGLWNAALHEDAFTLMCSYRADAADPRLSAEVLGRIAQAHESVRLECPAEFAPVFDRAVAETLSPAQIAMLEIVVHAEMPAAREVGTSAELRLLWLRLNMPATAERVLSRAQGYSAAAALRVG